MQCNRCGGEEFTKAGRDRQARQLFRCRACGRRLTARSSSAFSGYRFPDDVIALAVRWYLRFRLPYYVRTHAVAETACLPGEAVLNHSGLREAKMRAPSGT